jgi:hypothetical protein
MLRQGTIKKGFSMEMRLHSILAGILALPFEEEEVTLPYHHWRISLCANAGLRIHEGKHRTAQSATAK